jgi:hypothetical protein
MNVFAPHVHGPRVLDTAAAAAEHEKIRELSRRGAVSCASWFMIAATTSDLQTACLLYKEHSITATIPRWVVPRRAPMKRVGTLHHDSPRLRGRGGACSPFQDQGQLEMRNHTKALWLSGMPSCASA